MEIPYNGNATINDYGNSVEIIIPARRVYFFMIFFGIWVCGWIVAGLVIFFSLVQQNISSLAIFGLIWLVITSLIVGTIGRFVWWMAFGKEIITVEPGILTITKKGALFVKPKTYDLNEAKKFRVQEDFISYQQAWGFRSNNLFNHMNTGSIRFDYGMKTIKFAGNVDEAEANHLLTVLKNKKLLTESNF